MRVVSIGWRFGLICLVAPCESQQWGRIGTQGRRRLDQHPDAGAALNALAELARAKLGTQLLRRLGVAAANAPGPV